MAEYPYVRQQNWNVYRNGNEGGVFTVPYPNSDIYKYYQNYPFNDDYMNYPVEMNIHDKNGHLNKNGIYYAGRNPNKLKPYDDFDHDGNLSPFSAIDDLSPPVMNPTALISRSYLDDYRQKPPENDYDDDDDRINQLKIRRDIYKALPTPHINQHNFEDFDIHALKIKRDTLKPLPTPRIDKHDFDNTNINVLKIKRDPIEPNEPAKPKGVNFDETPIRPMKNNPFMDNKPLSFDDTPIKPLGFHPFLNDESPPTTVDSSIKSTPPKKFKPVKSFQKNQNKNPNTSFKKATSFDVPSKKEIEPIKQPQRRFVTMKLNKDAPIKKNIPPKFPNLDRKPINFNSIVQNDPKMNPFTTRSPSIRSNSVKNFENKPQTLINTKYVIINQNDSNKVTPRSISESLSRLQLHSPPQSPQPPPIPILSPLPILPKHQSPRPIPAQNITQRSDSKSPVQYIRKLAPQQDDVPVQIIRRVPKNTVPVQVVREASFDDGENEVVLRKKPRKTIVHHYFK